MATFSIGVRTSNTTTGNACFELRTGSGERISIDEIGIFMAAATASTFGFGRPAAIGVTPTSPVTPTAHDPADSATGATTALAWGTGPTIPALFIRRIGLPATIGAGVIWTFPEPIVVAVSSSVILWNLSTTGVADVYVTYRDR